MNIKIDIKINKKININMKINVKIKIMFTCRGNRIVRGAHRGFRRDRTSHRERNLNVAKQEKKRKKKRNFQMKNIKRKYKNKK